jgi:hypothetical protein
MIQGLEKQLGFVGPVMGRLVIFISVAPSARQAGKAVPPAGRRPF